MYTLEHLQSLALGFVGFLQCVHLRGVDAAEHTQLATVGTQPFEDDSTYILIECYRYAEYLFLKPENRKNLFLAQIISLVVFMLNLFRLNKNRKALLQICCI